MNHTRLLKPFTLTLMIILTSVFLTPALAHDLGEYLVIESDWETRGYIYTQSLLDDYG